MQRNIEFSLGEYYHVYNRGVDKREIFTTDEDRERFTRLLYAANGTKPFIFRDIAYKRFDDIDRADELVALGAYCLMPNHFHLLLKETTEGGISQFMEKLCTGYSMYFNKKYGRSGTLFQGNFKAEHANTDEYLKYLFAYIHLNPVKLIEPDWKESGIKDRVKAERYLHSYKYSSYLDHLGEPRQQNLILESKEFPGYFEKGSDFQSYVKDWLEFQPST